MAVCPAKIGLRQGLFVAFLLLAQSRTLVAQAQGVQVEKRSPSVVCSIRTERKDWSRSKPAILYVSVESVSDIPFEIPLWAGLSLEPVSPNDPLLTRLKNAALGASVAPALASGPSGMRKRVSTLCAMKRQSRRQKWENFLHWDKPVF